MVGSHGGRAPQHTVSVVALRLLVDGLGAAAIAQCCLANDRAALTAVIPRLTAQSDT
ncbi:hypothetical protein GGR75_002834 [Xanthomonas campestris]|nr:hypothetical protein [Xanthomonas campestris]